MRTMSVDVLRAGETLLDAASTEPATMPLTVPLRVLEALPRTADRGSPSAPAHLGKQIDRCDIARTYDRARGNLDRHGG